MAWSAILRHLAAFTMLRVLPQGIRRGEGASPGDISAGARR